MTTIAEAMREWFRLCPLINTEGQFNINYLDGEPVSYTLDDVPTSTVVRTYLDGTEIRARAFVLASTEEYGPDFLEQLAESGIWEQLVRWVETQNRRRQFPVLPTGLQPRRIEVTSSQYLYRAGATTARYQIQLRLEYYDFTKKRGA